MDEDKFEYFMKRTKEDLDHIRIKIDRLWDFRVMLIGGSIVVSVVCSSLISLASIYFGAR